MWIMYSEFPYNDPILFMPRKQEKRERDGDEDITSITTCFMP